MPASNTEFNDHTTGDEVVAAFADQVRGKTILITGANPGGIGGSSAIALAKASPKLLIIAGRSSKKLAETETNIQKVNANVAVKQLILDLSSQQSCKDAADEIHNNGNVPQIDILINNAGVMNIEERTLSPEGIEMQFATNHIGHFLFTNLIMPKLVASSKNSTVAGATRIINLSSRAVVYGPVRFSDWNFTKPESELPEHEHMSKQVRQQWNEMEDKPYIPQAAYGQSKSANVLFSLELNQRLLEKNGILSLALHPGAITTELGRHVPQDKLKQVMAAASSVMHVKNLEEGCSTSLTAALDPKLGQGDLFLSDCQVVDWAPAWCTDPKKAEQLWKLSEELVGQTF